MILHNKSESTIRRLLYEQATFVVIKGKIKRESFRQVLFSSIKLKLDNLGMFISKTKKGRLRII